MSYHPGDEADAPLPFGSCEIDTIPEPGELHDYITGDHIRRATQDETDASIKAAGRDGGPGVILVNGRRCYVEGGQS